MTSSNPTAGPRAALDEPVVVLVPGLGLDGREWRRVWPLLTGSSTVVTLPSMGQPAPPGCDLSVEALAQRLAAALPVGPPLVLVGHSASCQVVAQAALYVPRVHGLVLVGPTTDPAAQGWPRMIGRWLRTARHERAWEVRALTPQYRRTGLRSMARGMDRMRRHRTDRVLDAVSADVRVVRGEHDRIAPMAWCARLATGGTGRVVTVPGAGHMVPLTHPQAVAAEVVSLRLAGAGVSLPDAGRRDRGPDGCPERGHHLATQVGDVGSGHEHPRGSAAGGSASFPSINDSSTPPAPR